MKGGQYGKKTEEQKFQHQWEKSKSLIKQVFTFTKTRKNFDEGIPFKQLKEKIEISLKRNYSNQAIYDAISKLNRYGDKIGIYLRSSSGWVDDENNKRKREHRYYVPTELHDINDEETNLENKEENIHLKQKNLYHHRTITIPQEIKLEELRNEN